MPFQKTFENISQKVSRNVKLKKVNQKWKLEKLPEIEIRNGSWKVFAENEIQQKLKMSALKFFSESKLKIEFEAENGKLNGYVACSSLSKKAWVNSRLAKQLVFSFLENTPYFPI